MGRIIETIQNNWSGGILEDKRLGWEQSGTLWTTRYFSLTRNFDVFTYPKKLIPLLAGGTTSTFVAFDIVKFVEGGGKIYGLGVVTGTTRIKIFEWNAATYQWDACTTAEGAAGFPVRNEDVFFYYNGYLYMFGNGAELSRWNVTTHAYTDTYQAITYTKVAQPVHHPNDDCAYFFVDNLVYRLDNADWDGIVLTLPANMTIKSACPFGNYLAIGCVDDNNNSVSFIWDRDSSLSTLTERIDFGKGELKHLVNLNNKLVGIMNFYLDDAEGAGLGKILIKQASGEFAVTLNELVTDTKATADLMTATRFVKENKVFFPAGPQLNGDTRFGVWVVDENGRATLALDVAATSIQGIYMIGNVWFMAHDNDGSFYSTIYGTVSFETATASVYESLIFNAGDSDLSKKLLGAAVTFEKLPAAGQVVLKYRINGATSWTTLFTYTTDDALSHGAVNKESDGSNLPEYKEIEFRIESTGGAKITGLKFKSELIDRQLF
jgi:hypothetical protein